MAHQQVRDVHAALVVEHLHFQASVAAVPQRVHDQHVEQAAERCQIHVLAVDRQAVLVVDYPIGMVQDIEEALVLVLAQERLQIDGQSEHELGNPVDVLPSPLVLVQRSLA